MEYAIYITKLTDLKYVTDKYTRLYYGNEFCERLIPSAGDLGRAKSFAEKNKLDFTFVTGYVTNAGIKRLKPLLEILNRSVIKCEAVINDWGMLNLVTREYPSISPVLGRLLVKQKRCPSLINLLKRQSHMHLVKDPQNPAVKYLLVQKKLPDGLDAYYKGANAASVPIIHNFLLSLRIGRIELDNIGQGLLLEFPKDKIFASLYLPYVYITTTFFCPTASCGKKDSVLKIKPCGRECQRYVFKLRHKSFPKEIFLKGNTQFYKNTRCHFKEWGKIGVDRVVYEPELPV